MRHRGLVSCQKELSWSKTKASLGLLRSILCIVWIGCNSSLNPTEVWLGCSPTAAARRKLWALPKQRVTSMGAALHGALWESMLAAKGTVANATWAPCWLPSMFSRLQTFPLQLVIGQGRGDSKIAASLTPNVPSLKRGKHTVLSPDYPAEPHKILNASLNKVEWGAEPEEGAQIMGVQLEKSRSHWRWLTRTSRPDYIPWPLLL